MAGPYLGYYPNAGKCWLVTKPDKEETARSIVEETAINITTEGRKHLGAALGSRSYLEQSVNGIVEEWVGQVTKLAEFALSQPQAITGHYCTQGERELLALPVRMGGMGLTNPSQEAASEYVAFVTISGPLAQRIKSQVHEPPDETEIHAAQREICQVKNRYLKEKRDQVKGSVSGKTLRAVDLATQKGASSWLSIVPIRDMNFDLNKSEFRDAVKLRYDWDVPDMPSVCVCGNHFNVDHAMICKRGGFVIQRHNELRDLQAEMLRMVCSGVETEPVLQDITGEELNRGANTDLNQIYRQHETEKKRQYASRVLEVEQATFTPLVFSTTGGMAAECKRYHSRLAELLATKKGESYATTMSWIRARVSFALLGSALLCLRGSRAKRRNPPRIAGH